MFHFALAFGMVCSGIVVCDERTEPLHGTATMAMDPISPNMSGAAVIDRLDDHTETTSLSNGVAATVADEDVDDYGTVVWQLALTKTDGTRERWTVFAWHDGTSSVDATTATYTRSGVGPDNGHTITVDVDGSGSSQTMRLRVTANGSDWSADVTRIPHKAA